MAVGLEQSLVKGNAKAASPFTGFGGVLHKGNARIENVVVDASMAVS